MNCFYLLAIANSAVIKKYVPKKKKKYVAVFVCVPVFNSFGYISKRGIAGSYSNFMFNFLGNSSNL